MVGLEYLARTAPSTNATPTDVYPQEFNGSPEPVEELHSYNIVGVDVKITPDDEAKIIEVNGAGSGIKGFARLGEHDDLLDDLGGSARDTLPDQALDYLTEAFFRTNKAGFSYHKARHGREKLIRGGNPQIPDAWHDAYGSLAACSLSFDHLANRKYTLDMMNDEDSFANTYLDTSDGRESALSHEGEWYVEKPVLGSRGRGVDIVHQDKLSRRDYETPYSVIQPFIPSKDFTLSDGETHDGCARVLASLSYGRDGCTVDFHGGYWRLSPEPKTPEPAKESNVANLTGKQPAQPYPMNDGDKVLIENQVEEGLATFYMRNQAIFVNYFDQDLSDEHLPAQNNPVIGYREPPRSPVSHGFCSLYKEDFHSAWSHFGKVLSDAGRAFFNSIEAYNGDGGSDGVQ